MEQKKLFAVFVAFMVVVAAVRVQKAEADADEQDFKDCYNPCFDECFKDGHEGGGYTYCEMKCDGKCAATKIKASVNDVIS